MNSIPKLPEGFELDQTESTPALPAGFKLDTTPSPTTTRPATGTKLPASAKTSTFDEAVEGAKAAGEVALSLGLPLVTWPTSISAQLMTRAKGGTAEQARKVRDATMELGTYEPKTERAKNVLAALSPAIQTLTLGKSAFATSPKQVEEEVDQITKNPTLNTLLKTGAVGLQQFAEPVRHAMTELGVGPGTTTYDLATSAAEVTGFAKAGRGIKNTRQGAKNFLREVKSEKAAAKAPLIELESQQQPSTARPAAKIEPAVKKPKVGEETPRTILEEADKQFAKPEVREEVNDYYRDLDKINEAKSFEEMEAYYKQLDEAPKPPEGFKIDVDPAMEKLKQEREVKTTTEKPLQDVEYREVSKDEVLPADSEVKMDTSTGKSYVKVAAKVPAVEEVKIEDVSKIDTGRKVEKVNLSAEALKYDKPEKFIEDYYKKLDEVAQQQRGEPESKMLRLSGSDRGYEWQPSQLYAWAAEHVGDLTHRIFQKPDFFKGKAGAKEKIDKAINSLKNPYGFEKEVNEQIVNNYNYGRSKGKYQDQTLEEFRDEFIQRSKDYAEAHKELPVYNEVGQLAKDAAIAIGEWRFKDATVSLEKLKDLYEKGDWEELVTNKKALTETWNKAQQGKLSEVKPMTYAEESTSKQKTDLLNEADKLLSTEAEKLAPETSKEIPTPEEVNRTKPDPVLLSDPFFIQSGVKAVSETFKKGSESVHTVWNKAVENSRTAEGIDKGLKATGQDLREAVLNPEKVTAVHEVAKKDFEGLATAEEKKNIFLLRHLEPFIEKMKGIKSGSKESELIGAALDGKIQRSELPKKLHSAFDFLKQEFDFLINEYARLRAGSEEAYQKVLNLALSEKAQRIELKKLSPEDKLVYDTLHQAARDIRKGRKASQLNEDEKLVYDEIRQEISDFKGKNIKKSLTEGEGEAFDALRTKIKDYLPRLFDKEELVSAFKEEITMNKEKLQKATVPGNITRLKNRINMLESSVKKLEGGEWVRYSQLPRDIQFRFFNKRKGKQGYSLDAIKAYETYIHGIARKMFDEPAIREIANTFSELPFELRDYVKKLTDHYMGYGGKKSFEWLSSNLASIEWMRTLGLNPRSAVVNYTQRFNTLADIGIKYSGMAETLMMRDLALKTKDKLTGNKRTYVTDEIFKRSGIAREIPSVMMEGTASTTLEQMRAVVGWMFNKVEFGNRKHAFLAGYLKAKADNPKLTEQELIKKGINTVHKTQFRYGKLGMPKMMWNPVGRVAFQFTSYPIKQAQFLYDLWKEDKVKFLKWIAYTQGFNYTMQELFDTDLTNAVGVGINFGNALRMMEKLGEGKYKDAERYLAQTAQRGGGLLPSGDYPGVGPLPSALIKIAAASKEGQAIETLKKELMPVVGSRVRQTYLALKNAEGGEYPIYNDKGKLMYKLTADQLMRRFFFSRTGFEYRRGEKFREEKALKEQYRDVSGEVTKQMTDAILNDDDKAMNEALELAEKYDVEPDPVKIQKELYYRMLTEEERKVIGKDELYQIMREGETMEERYAE
jgi:hypothetical protein